MRRSICAAAMVTKVGLLLLAPEGARDAMKESRYTEEQVTYALTVVSRHLATYRGRFADVRKLLTDTSTCIDEFL